MNAEVALWTAVGATGAAALFSALYIALSDLSRGKLEEIALRKSTQGASPAALARAKRILADVRGHARAMALPRMLFSVVVIVAVLWWVEAIDSAESLTTTMGVITALATAVG